MPVAYLKVATLFWLLIDIILVTYFPQTYPFESAGTNNNGIMVTRPKTTQSLPVEEFNSGATFHHASCCDLYFILALERPEMVATHEQKYATGINNHMLAFEFNYVQRKLQDDILQPVALKFAIANFVLSFKTKMGRKIKLTNKMS